MTNPFPQLTSLTDISADTYVRAETYVMALLKESFPDRSFGYGTALYWHVVVPAATAIAAMEVNAAAMGSSLSLKWLRDNAAIVNEELATAILSNYYNAPAEGAKSQGSAMIVVSEQAPYSVVAGTVFTAGGIRYVATETIFAQVSPVEVVDPNDRLLMPRTDGNWQFQVPLESEDIGVGTFAPMNSVFTLENPPANFVSSYAATDISGGSNSADIKEAAAAVPESFAAQTFGSALNVSAMLAEAFPGTKTASIGMGDPEQWRDTHNLLQVQTGGMVDLYEMTQSAVGSATKEITATLLDPVLKKWEFTLSREECPGVYAVLSVVPRGSQQPTMPILSSVRSISIPETGYRPLITLPEEAAFSAYQAITVVFTDTYGSHAGLSAGATRSYDIGVIQMPLIQEINDYLLSDRMTGADNVLVRAAVPCVTRIALGIRLLDSDSLTDAEISEMKQSIVNKVAARGFGYGILSSSIIVDAVHDYISGRSDVGANTVSLRGDIYAPTGEVLVMEGTEIRIPNEPSKMVTKDNTVFLTDVSRIDISFLPAETT